MRWKSIRIVTVAVVSVLALIAAGCGGGGSKSSATPETTTTTETTTEATTTESTPTTTETTTETTTSTTPDFVASGKCKELSEKAQKAFGQASGANADIEKSAQAFQDFVDEVPSEIRGDVQVFADAISAYADAIKGTGYTPGQAPTADQIAKLQEAAKSFNQEKVQQASANITAWVQKNC